MKEKRLRASWKLHDAQQQIFDPDTEGMKQLLKTRDALADIEVADAVPKLKLKILPQIMVRRPHRPKLQLSSWPGVVSLEELPVPPGYTW